MSNTPPPGNASQEPTAAAAPTPLTRAVLELDEYASKRGWDQPAQLFALVDTETIRRHEPAMAQELGLAGDTPAGALTSVAQEELPTKTSLDEFLATIAWPDLVVGCALVLERQMLPSNAEDQVPSDTSDDDLARWVAQHPDRQEVRMTVAVLRDGARECALRLREKDSPTEVLTGANLVPGLADALAATFED